MELKVKLDEGAKMPTRAHALDAGYDLYTPQDIYLAPGQKLTIDTGVHIEIPPNYFGDIRPKSGLLFKHNITTAGTVDSGYTGAVNVRLVNFGNEVHCFKAGDKIAQMVIVPCVTPELREVQELAGTERGTNGFGSSGK